MQSTFAILMLSILIAGCGRHESESFGRAVAGTERRVEKPSSPSEIMAEAVRGGDLARMETSVAAGFAVNDRLGNGNTPLIEAVIWNRADAVVWLLARGADKAVRGDDGLTATDHAKDKPHLLRLLDPSLVDGDLSRLFEAVRANRFNDVKKMLGEGVDPNRENDAGETPLILAIKMKFDNVVRVFLQPGTKTDVNRRNRAGESPLGVAVAMASTRVEQMLRSRGAEL